MAGANRFPQFGFKDVGHLIRFIFRIGFPVFIIETFFDLAIELSGLFIEFIGDIVGIWFLSGFWRFPVS